MNPFTKFLQQWSNNKNLHDFVSYWDRLEALTIQVYRGNVSVDDGRGEFEVVWPWLRKHYPNWQAALEPFWMQTKAAGQPTQTDPFQLLLDLPDPEAVLDNWRVMQHLPAAREALNKRLMT